MYGWTQVVLFLMLAVLTLPALGAMVKWPGLHDGTINKELSYGMLLAHYLPPGILGLALVAMFASIMSTVDSNMNFGAQVFINDVYRRSLVRDASTQHYMRVGKVVMLVIMGLAVLVATNAHNVIDISVFMLGLSSAEMTANWGQWWWWRFNGKARLAASFGGPVIFLLNKYVVFKYLVDAGSDTTYLVVLASIALTCVLWIAVSLLTKPDPEEKLIEFYKRARPMGWWGPVARKAGIEHAGLRPILAGLGIAVSGAVTVAAGTIAFSCVYVARWNVAAVAAAMTVVVGIGFRTTYSRYMRYLHVEDSCASPGSDGPAPAGE